MLEQDDAGIVSALTVPGAGTGVKLLDRAIGATWHRYQRWRDRPTVLVHVVGASVSIINPQEGEIRFPLRITNFGVRKVALHRVEISNIYATGVMLADRVELHKASGEAKGRQCGNGQFAIELKQTDIRRVLHGIGRPSSALFGSALELMGSVVFTVERGSRTFLVYSDFRVENPKLNVDNAVYLAVMNDR